MSNPIRVLHVLQRMEAGGTQAFLMNLYRNIDRTKVQFDFLVEYTSEQFYDDEVQSLGGRIYRSSFREDHNLFRFKRFLRKFFGEHNEYQIVHCHAYTIGYFVLKAADRAGVPVRIAHSHNNDMSGITVPIKLIMRRLFPIHATYFMAASTEAGKFLFGNRPFDVVKNAIDIERFRFNPTIREEVRSEFGFADNFVIGNVGRLHQQKNQLFLLQIFAQIEKAMPNARLLLVGNGPLHDKLVEQAENLGIDNKMTLLSNRSDMDRLYQAMDVFVLPSLYEGLGIVAIEAQSAGLPTICSAGVAEDANVSPLFQRLSLDDSASRWAQIICSNNGRRDSEAGPEGARLHGFDVVVNSARMQEWYLKEVRNA